MLNVKEPSAENIIAVWRTPFAGTTPQVMTWKPGVTLGEMIDDMKFLPADFEQRGNIVIGQDHVVERKYWRRVKMKPGRAISFTYALADGGGGGKSGLKAVLSIVIAIATVLTAGLASLGYLGFAAGTLGAKLLAGGITILGALARAAMSKPPASPPPGLGQGQAGAQPASVQGNLLQAGAPIPAVIGTRWIYPILLCAPLVERIGLDEYAEGVFGLAGPHQFNEIRIADADIEEAEDVEYQTRNGWQSDTKLTLVQRYGSQKQVGLELTPHATESDSYSRLANQTTPTASIPKFHSFASSLNADEIWFHLTAPAGLNYANDATIRVQVPIRIRMRKQTSDPWILLPELHMRSKNTNELRPSIKIIWGADPGYIPPVPSNEGWVMAFKYAPGQVPAPVSAAWDASVFSTGAGNDVLRAGTEDSTKVKRVVLTEHEARIYLDEAIIPKGEYQIEIKRGEAFNSVDFNSSSYQYQTSVRDHFWYVTNGQYSDMTQSREDVTDRIFLARFGSVFNSHPISGGMNGPGLAIIAVKCVNRDIPNLAVNASGYVQDWDGAGWNNWTTSSNPGTWFRHVLRGPLNPKPLDEEMIDNASILTFRSHCTTMGYTVDMIAEGAKIDDVLDKICGCGYGRLRMSETWGVIRDYDRSAEEVSQVFSSRNSASLAMAKAFDILPDAIRAVYRDSSNIDAENEVYVYREPDAIPGGALIEQINYDGIVTLPKVQARAAYDLAAAQARDNIWTLRAPAEAIVTQRGDLVGINHDIISEAMGSARITEVNESGSNVISIEVDSDVMVYNEPDMHSVTDMHSVADMHLVGRKTAIAVRQTDGSIVTMALGGASGLTRTLTLAAPHPIDTDIGGNNIIAEDCLLVYGTAGEEFMRMLVFSVTYDRDYFANVVLVPEAPELFS